MTKFWEEYKRIDKGSNNIPKYKNNNTRKFWKLVNSVYRVSIGFYVVDFVYVLSILGTMLFIEITFLANLFFKAHFRINVSCSYMIQLFCEIWHGILGKFGIIYIIILSIISFLIFLFNKKYKRPFLFNFEAYFLIKRLQKYGIDDSSSLNCNLIIMDSIYKSRKWPFTSTHKSFFYLVKQFVKQLFLAIIGSILSSITNILVFIIISIIIFTISMIYSDKFRLYVAIRTLKFHLQNRKLL